MKVFVTVGTQLPFDRMVRAVDQWAAQNPSVEVFAQVGPSRFQPHYCRFASFIDTEQCHAHTSRADLVVAHAGMGSIITALELGRPIIIMPRRAALREHRSDHQIATVRRLAGRPGLQIALNEEYLRRLLEQRLLDMAETSTAVRTTPLQLIGRIRCFIEEGAILPAPQSLALDLPHTPICDAAAEVAISGLSHH